MPICVYICKYRDKKSGLLPVGWQSPSLRLTELQCIKKCKYINQIKKYVLYTHSMPSINGVSGQSFSGNLCKIIPLLDPLPEIVTQLT